VDCDHPRVDAHLCIATIATARPSTTWPLGVGDRLAELVTTPSTAGRYRSTPGAVTAAWWPLGRKCGSVGAGTESPLAAYDSYEVG
jgi:hypothetical protein